MGYEPGGKYRIRWHVAIPVVFVVALVIYSLISFMIPEAEIKKFTVGNLTQEQTFDALNHERKETFLIQDYTYYGESLGLYSEPYILNHNDSLEGKTVKLHNVCTNKVVTITVGQDIDQKIFIPDLQPGLYELTVIDDLVEKHLIYKEEFQSDTKTTVTRNGKRKKATLFASKELLRDYGVKWQVPYLFLEVKEEKTKDDKVDIYIDPYGLNTDFQYVPDKGSKANGLEEYKETVYAANILKKRLESYGLKVELTRNQESDQPLAIYGDQGRLAHGYDIGAKYFIHLQMNDSELNERGYEIWHSAYVSDVIGTRIMYSLKEKFDIVGGPYTGVSGSGVSANYVSEEGFDHNLYLRESGGKATFAAMYSKLSRTENASFKEKDGMYAMEIDLGYITNTKDATLWKEQKEAICNEIADSFADAISVEKRK